MTIAELLRRRTLRRAVLALIVGFAIGVALVVPGRDPNPPPDRGAGGVAADRPNTAARAFFDRYVTADGRVVRHDQGGDTVSEGQAYALLLAAGTHDEGRFATVWDWTRRNLQRPDGLLSWRWRDGAVADRQPAADADVDTARALALAAAEFDHPDLRTEAVRIAGAVLDHELVSAGGRSALAAGPWAVAERIVNASYWSPCAAADLARMTGDGRWQTLADDAVALLDRATDGGTGLPSDWSRLDDGGALQAVAAPGSGAGPLYGFDAARVPLRLAERCGADGAADEAGRDLAATLWPVVRALPDDASRETYHLDGTPAVPPEARHPAGLVGAAAAASAAGDTASTDRLLAAAGSLDQQHPTYYGSALLALARLTLPPGASAPPHPEEQQRSFAPGELQLIATSTPDGEATTTRSADAAPAPPSPSPAGPSRTSSGQESTGTSSPPQSTTTSSSPATTVTSFPPESTTTSSSPGTTGTSARPSSTTSSTRPGATSSTTGRPPVDRDEQSPGTTGPPSETTGPAKAARPATGPLRAGILTRPPAAGLLPSPANGAPDSDGGTVPPPPDPSDDTTPARTGVLLAGAGLTALFGTRLGRRSL